MKKFVGALNNRMFQVSVVSLLVLLVGVFVLQVYALTPAEKAQIRYDELMKQGVFSVLDLGDVWAEEL